MSVHDAHEAAMMHWQKAIAIKDDDKLTALAQDLATKLDALHAQYPTLTTLEAKLTAAIPVAQAGDALQAYGIQGDQNTHQQVAIRHAVQATGTALKHVINESMIHTALPPVAA